MKKLNLLPLTLLFTVVSSLTLLAQAPQKIAYQAVARNASGTVLPNQTVKLRFSVRNASSNGTIVYQETQTATTSNIGLFNVNIGEGTVSAGTFAGIDWSNGAKFMQVELDPQGGNAFIDMGTQQMLSVPYALYAETADNIRGGSAFMITKFTSDSTIGDSKIYDDGFELYSRSKHFGIGNASGFNGGNIQWDSTNSRLNINYNDVNPNFSNTAISINGKPGPQAGYVGIGTLTPEARLEVSGQVKITGGAPGAGKVLTSDANGLASWGPAGGSGGFTHYIGEPFGGGVIFHLWKDNANTERGLIVALTLQSNATAWSNVGGLIGSSAQSTWNGLSNSNAIVGQAGHTNSAAKLCLDLVSGGQSDWYLPSIDELVLLWNNRFNVNKTLSSISGSALIGKQFYYWSSLEEFDLNCWQLDLSTGIPETSLKSTTKAVRAIRAF